jgi:hypothetical protein
MKILPMGAESFHADRQTDVMRLLVAFRNFGNAPKNIFYLILSRPNSFKTTQCQRYMKYISEIMLTGEEGSTSRKSCHIATLSITNHVWT